MKYQYTAHEKIRREPDYSFTELIEMISPRIWEYNLIRLQFTPIANAARDQFNTTYNTKMRSLDDVVHQVHELFIECMIPVWETCVKMLISAGVSHIDVGQFITQYKEYYDFWTDAFEDLIDQYAEINLTQQQMSEYRKARCANRSRLVGGGFGIAGAAKGIATAGAANMAYGAVHSVVNMFGNFGSGLVASGKKSEIFKDPETQWKLSQAVYDSAFSCHFALIACLNNETDCNILMGISADQRQKSESAVNNLNGKLVTAEAERSTILGAFTDNPYNYLWYTYMVGRFGDQHGDLEQTALKFGIDLTECKRETIDDAARKLDTSSLETAKNALQQIELLKGYYHYFHTFERQEEIEAEIDAFDREERTLQLKGAPPLVFKTIQEAETARQQWIELEPRLLKYDMNDEVSCQQAYSDIRAMKLVPQLKKILMTGFHSRCQAFDKKARTKFDRIYDTREEARQAEKEYVEIKQQLSASMEAAALAQIKMRIGTANLPDKIKSELNKLVFEVENAPELKKVRSINALAAIALIALIIIGFPVTISATQALHETHVIRNGVEMLMHQHTIVEKPSIMDGLKNGIGVFGKSIVTYFLGAFADYIDGFSGTLDGNIMWMLFGWIKALWDNLWLALERYFITLWYTFRQSSNPLYCIGYAVSTLFSWSILLRLSKSEEEQLKQK